MIEKYLTITSNSEGVYKEKGSKFLSFAIPVSSVDEVKIILDEFKKKYFDARHVCYAYVIGNDQSIYRSNDDGEPSGTAGRPILGQIHSRELTNILVIVVRYFGGILLGTGGLITAYKEAAADALNFADIVEKQVLIQYLLEFPYVKMNGVMKLIKDLELKILHQHFETDCEIKVTVPIRSNQIFLSKVEDLDEVKCSKIETM